MDVLWFAVGLVMGGCLGVMARALVRAGSDPR
jgi:hypothetical protein